MKILKFTADWCVACKNMSKLLEDIPNNITEVDIESDEGDDLSTKFKIRSIPTLVVIDSNDEEVKRFIGTMSKAGLEDMIKEYEGENE